MSLLSALKISSSAMTAQMTRLNTTASNLANMDVVGSTPDGAYKAKRPIFKTVMEAYTTDTFEASVKVNGIHVSDQPNAKSYDPSKPSSLAAGFEGS